ncbi:MULTISPECIES: DUF1800 domain-containing protein [unclassified Pseudonocardia]|jgi:uncharacterized protein (DUF1800 family)|uniref:DUF1800 domain-containing protein n=1 Tax=unclassified Pseudonocardia TaxID=2619320 RepID=UPI0009623209|nr:MULTISPECIES: DUF1800 domain-containing protein [unclassified Pseudonocardia]MBN9098581.1 DUF1800 domain-containing protein [Pseudonocardia sp.]OJY45507.1 MAG: hypothetical protein BGP03_20845 [Pseudonocardia sp. 73-21]
MTDADAIRRLLQRVGLGPRPGELARATTGGFDATLAALTAPGPDAGATATPPPAFPAPPAPAARTDVAARKAREQAEAAQARTLVVWWLDRMAAADAPYPERMTWFWHGHFATSVQKVKSAALMYGQNATQRRLGGGDFRALARAMIVDPAMLVWLDGTGNRVGKPNENLAREFMELFTLGVGNYTETDVREAARALTGWRIDAGGDTSSVNARNHDPGPETVLGTTGAYDADGLVDLLVTRPASPRFVAGRIWTRFVSDTPPDPATMDTLVAAYGANHDVTAVLRAAVTAPAFRDPASVLVRQPVEWLVAALRALKLPASKVAPAALRAGLTGLGQTPFHPPNVGGWPAGTPWLTTAAALARLKLAQALVAAADLSPVTDVAAGSRVEATAALLGLPAFTSRTAAALAPLAGTPPQLVAAALASPENAVSA